LEDHLASDIQIFDCWHCAGLIDSMNDIVWAINPEQHDRLSNLVYRMRRRFANDLLGGCKIGLQFHSSDVELRVGDVSGKSF